MAVKITTLRSNFNKLNESIKQYIAEGKPSQEFLAKLVNLDREGVLNSFPDAWVIIFRKYYDAKFFHLCEFQATRHENEFVKFLNGLKSNEQADCINSTFRRQLGPDHKSLFALIYLIIFHQEKHGLGSHIISAFARYYDLKSVVGVINKIRKDHVFNDNLSIRFDQECETTEDFSVWKHPIFKEILRDDQKMRAFEVARKKHCDAVDYAVALGIDLEKTKPQFTDDLLRKNDLRQIKRDFNPKLHDQDRVLAHITELIKKEQNPDPTELAKEFLNGDGRIPFSEMLFLMPRFPFRGY